MDVTDVDIDLEQLIWVVKNLIGAVLVARCS